MRALVGRVGQNNQNDHKIGIQNHAGPHACCSLPSARPWDANNTTEVHKSKMLSLQGSAAWAQPY